MRDGGMMGTIASGKMGELMNRFHCLFLLAISQFSASYMTLAAEGEKPAAAPARVLSEQAREALASFRLKQGFRIELVAAEPLVASPVAMAFDENGRLFVVEMRDYPDRRDQRLGQIRLLEDTDGDGVFDSGKTYGEDLAWPSAVACYGGGVFVAATPEIIYFQDSQHDGVADVRRVVFNGFGGGTSKFTVDALLNNFNWGLDNRIHGAAAGLGGQVNNLKTANPEQLELAHNDFAFDPKALTIAAEAGPGVSGLSFDSRGRRWLSDFTHPLKQPMYDPRYLSRNTYFPKAP